MEKFRFFSTRRLTSGCLERQLCHTNQTKLTASRSAAHRIQSGAEPIVFLTFVEDDLQSAGPNYQCAQTDAVEPVTSTRAY